MAALEIVALDTATPQLRAPASGDTYLAPRAMALTPEALTGSAATSSLSIAQTWNTTGTPTAFDLNVTDTASNATSLLMNLRTDGVSRFRVTKFGSVTIANNFFQTSGSIQAGASFNIGGDTYLFRDAANTLALRNGTNAQAFNVYQSFTDASNYTRGKLSAASSIVGLTAESAGTGSADIDVALTPKGTGRVRYGTHETLGAETVTGYIEIKDAGGTVRKLAVVS